MLVELNYKKKEGRKRGKRKEKKKKKRGKRREKRREKIRLTLILLLLYYLGLKVLSPTTSVPMHSMKTFLLITKLPSAASKSNGGGEFERGKRTNRSR
jgi:hypothetical protein